MIYRAFISVPIEADSDDLALARAFHYANSLLWPDSDVICGHVELLGTAIDGTAEIRRVVMADGGFKIPADWR